MSDGMNKVILLGRLGVDPELKFLPTGTALLSFRLATNESYLDKNKESQERTEWHQVTVWGARAEALSKILAKGMCVMVEGSLHTTTFEKDGSKRYRTEITAKEVLLTGRKPSTDSEDTGHVPDKPLRRNGQRNEDLMLHM